MAKGKWIPENRGNFAVNDRVRYDEAFIAKFPHSRENMAAMRGRVCAISMLGLVKICDVVWDSEPDFTYSICFDNLKMEEDIL